MPDTLEQTPASTEAQTQQPAVNNELAANMAASLNAFLPADKQIATPQANAEEGAQQNAEESVPRETPPAQTSADQPFQFSAFTEKYGHKTPEEVFKELDAWRAHQANPGSDIEFKDDESANIFKAFTKGDLEPIRQYLNRQHEINSLIGLEVTGDTAAQIVKFGMQLKHKDLKPEEIDWLYNKRFSVPPKPAMGADEDQLDYDARVSAWQQVANDKQMELMIEAKMIRPEFESAKKQLTLPKVIDAPDEGYAQYRKMLEDQAKQDAEVREAYKTFTPKSIETKLPFKDEANKISFEFQFEPDKDNFAKSVDMVSDMDKFWGLFYKPDGTPDRQKFLAFVDRAVNFDSYLIAAMTQAKNAAIKAQLPDNTGNGIIRQLPQQQEENELDKNMKAALHGFM